MNKQVIVAPSVLAADFANLQRDIAMLNQSQADWLHIDIMDGVFVPNISFGMPVLEAIEKHTPKPLDIHLMIVQPEKYLQTFSNIVRKSYQERQTIISVHLEACTHLHRTLQQIKDLGCKAGVALNPHTSVSLLEDITQEIDLVCLMSVNPGFGGQKFIEHTYQKVNRLKDLILQKNAPTLIEIDGGVNLQNASKLLAEGADVLVAGNFVFSSPTPLQTISELKQL